VAISTNPDHPDEQIEGRALMTLDFSARQGHQINVYSLLLHTIHSMLIAHVRRSEAWSCRNLVSRDYWQCLPGRFAYHTFKVRQVPLTFLVPVLV